MLLPSKLLLAKRFGLSGVFGFLLLSIDLFRDSGGKYPFVPLPDETYIYYVLSPKSVSLTWPS